MRQYASAERVRPLAYVRHRTDAAVGRTHDEASAAYERARLRIAFCERSWMNIDDYMRTAPTALILTLCLTLGACSERTNREDFSSLIKGKTEQQVRKNA